MTNNAELKIKCNTLCVTKECRAEFPVKGSGLSSLDSSILRVELLCEALLVQHKYGHTNNTKHV